MEKLRYSVDPYNRLLVKKGSRTYPIEGEFKTERNELVFLPSRKSPFTKELDLPRRIRFAGSWRLSRNHDLSLSLTETDYQYKGDELDIRGRLLSCEADALVFQTRFKKGPEEDRISLLRLGGRWQADKSNQLNFRITRDVDEDVLRFTGDWEVNKNQQIIYTYEKEDLVRRTKTTEYLEFRGFWELESKDRITYALDLKNNSFFQFRGVWEVPERQGKRGEIICKVGAGIKRSAKERVFSLFGNWRLRESKKLLFEINYGRNRLREIIFGASVFLDKNNELVFELKNKRKEGLGIGVRFKRSFLRENVRVFLRLSKMAGEKRLEAGIKIDW